MDTGLLEKFTGGIEPKEISAIGLIGNNKLYLQPCNTRYGDYPCNRSRRYAAHSLTKARGTLIALLRLAGKYGDNKGWMDWPAPENETVLTDSQKIRRGIGWKPSPVRAI